MNALVFQGPHDLRWQDWPEPAPGRGEALVAVRAIGICGSDVHGYTGESGRRTPPMVMGHEATGEVVALGPDAAGAWLGQRVVMQPILFCEHCDECRTGRVQLCRNRCFFGGNVNGAMAERIAIPTNNLRTLSDALSYQDGTLNEPLAVALHAARRAGGVSGRTVLIAGGGPIGLLTLAAVRELGARAVVITDIVAGRREAAMALGADAALDPSGDDWKAQLAGALGSVEVDLAFDAVGIPPTFRQALEVVRPGGAVVAIGGWREVPVDLARLVAREIHVLGTFNFTPDEFDEARRWLEEGCLEPRHLITDSRPLAEGAAVFADLAARRLEAIKMVLTNAK